MPKIIDKKSVMRLAGLEANALFKAGTLPANFKGSRIRQPSTPIRDTDGEELFYRVPLENTKRQKVFLDIAANPIFGSTILAYHMQMDWNPQEIIQQADAATRKRNRDLSYDRAELVAFSYPKIAVQFLKGDKEAELVELYSWNRVPAEEESKDPYFSRKSIKKIIPIDAQRKNETQFNNRIQQWAEIVPTRAAITPEVIDTPIVVNWPAPQHEERVVHYSTDDATHVPCYELVGQHTSVWCVAASTKMILDFYRFVYTQDRIAAEEGLGTHAAPNGLPYGQEAKVVNTIEKLSSNGLDATLNMNPNWAEFRTEMLGNRPLISFIPGHSRTVAGYSQTKLFIWYTSRFLRVYDPWAPHVGTITWENFETQTYRATFTIKPKTV
jgi:Peptidase_C39 like family